MTQPDHAALSARILASWQDDLIDAGLRPTVLVATREHDNGWCEIDAAPFVDSSTGRPHDFLDAPAQVKQRLWPRGVARLGASAPAAGALVAQHALTVLERYRRQPAWAGCFEQLERERDRLLAVSALQPFGSFARFIRAYRGVFLADLLSLIFCCRWTQPFDETGYRIQLRDDTLHIAPDPFGGTSVPLSIPGRRVPARYYRSDEELQEEVARAAVVELHGVAVGGSGEARGAGR